MKIFGFANPSVWNTAKHKFSNFVNEYPDVVEKKLGKIFSLQYLKVSLTLPFFK